MDMRKCRKYDEEDLVFLDVHGEVLSFDEVLDRVLNAVDDENRKRRFSAG